MLKTVAALTRTSFFCDAKKKTSVIEREGFGTTTHFVDRDVGAIRINTLEQVHKNYNSAPES